MRSKKRRRGTPLMAAGILMLLAAAVMVGSNAWEERQAGEISAVVTQELRTQMVRRQSRPAAEVPEEEPTEEERGLVLDGRSYLGVLTIPALDLELPVMAELSDANLRRAPCRYVGGAEEENLVIAGHNYRTHFGALDRLPEGSEVVLETVDGDVLRYQVTEKEVLEATAIEEMTDSGHPMTLFTCTYGGGSRVTLRCDWAA